MLVTTEADVKSAQDVIYAELAKQDTTGLFYRNDIGSKLLDVKPKCVLVSACLLGEKCKYNGGHNYNQALVDYVADKEVVAICPEVLAGLPTPREPVELVDGHVLDKRGNCYDDLFEKGLERCIYELLKSLLI